MSDLVVTVPRGGWEAWLAEGDCAGDAPSGRIHGFRLYGVERPPVVPGDRLYVVAHGRLRGYALVSGLRVAREWAAIDRYSFARAVTIPGRIEGFPGWRRRWWDVADEVPFPEWRTAGVWLAHGKSPSEHAGSSA